MGLSGRKASGGLGDLVHIIIVVVLVGLVFVFGSKLFGAILGGGNKDSLSNFNALADNIEMMINKPTSFEHQYFTAYLDRNDYIFGFRDISTLQAFQSLNPYIAAAYPEKCNHKSCLCFYQDLKKGNFPLNPKVCKTFDSEIIFHSTSSKTRVMESGGSGAILYLPYQTADVYADYPAEAYLDYKELMLGGGDQKAFYYLYLEKFVENGRIHILITNNLDEDQIKERIALLSLCPQNSEDECLGKRVNTNVGSGFCYYDNMARKCSFLQQQVSNCQYDEKILYHCMCGSQFVLGGSGSFCFKNSLGQHLVLPFNCQSNIIPDRDCKSYCLSLTDGTDGCDSKEEYYCSSDPCDLKSLGVVCEVKISVLGTSCVKV